MAARILLRHIKALSPLARRCWNLASRTFDIGIQGGTDLRAFEEVQLTPRTLGWIAAVGARVQVTVYGSQLAESHARLVVPHNNAMKLTKPAR